MIDREWAEMQFDAVAAHQTAVREFDASDDGERYKKITGLTMWESLGGDTLPVDAEDLEDSL